MASSSARQHQLSGCRQSRHRSRVKNRLSFIFALVDYRPHRIDKHWLRRLNYWCVFQVVYFSSNSDERPRLCRQIHCRLRILFSVRFRPYSLASIWIYFVANKIISSLPQGRYRPIPAHEIIWIDMVISSSTKQFIDKILLLIFDGACIATFWFIDGDRARFWALYYFQ